MDFPDFDLPTADGERLSKGDLLGRPWFVYMARHPGCFVCQSKLADVLERREEVRALGGDVLLSFQAAEDYCRMWTEKSKANGDIPSDLAVLVDPDATLYEEVGTIRGGRALRDPVRTLGSLWRSREHIHKWRLSSNDMLRMGADIGLRADGSVAFRHIAQDPEDRADPREVIAALGTAA